MTSDNVYKVTPVQEQCVQYWPQTKNSPEKIGSQLSVELLSEGEFEDYICRELKITDLTVSTFVGHVILHVASWPLVVDINSPNEIP